MRHRLALILANTGLLAVALVLLASPLLLGQLLSSSQSGALGVSQVAPAGRQLAVYVNSTDFSQYASFNPSPIVEPLFYQTSVTFTVFGGQQAAYNGLLTLYNPGTSSLKVSVESGNLSGATAKAKVWLTLSPEGHSAITLTTDQAEAGASQIKVADASSFEQGQVIIDNQVLKASRQNATTLLLAKALDRALPVGEKVYLGAAFYNEQLKPTIGQTQDIVLPPQGRALLTLTAATTDEAEQQQLVLPLSITAD
jgi:hypothetical protein